MQFAYTKVSFITKITFVLVKIKIQKKVRPYL